MEDLQPILDSLGGIIFPDCQLAAAGIADSLDLGRVGGNMIACAAGGANPAAYHSVLDDFVSDFNGDNLVDANILRHQRLCLGDGSGHTVQNEALLAVGLRYALFHNSNDHFVGHQLTGVHISLRLKANLSAVLYCFTENVSGGDGGNTQLFADDLSLGALARTGSTKKNDVHYDIPLNYSRKPL